MATPAAHICHLSLLNPAIHSRIFFKMARAQAAAGYRVSIIAQDPAPAPYMRDGIQIVPIGVFGRLNWRRAVKVRTIERLAADLQAHIYQVHTIELLSLARRLKQAVPGAKVVWDMHEDYAANIAHAGYYAAALRPLLLQQVQRQLHRFPHWGDGLLLAEDCFQGLVALPEDRVAVVRNKFEPQGDGRAEAAAGPQGLPYMLVTGTLAENWGVLRAVELWQRLNKLRPLGLVIAGHGQDAAFLRQVQERIGGSGHAERAILVGGNEYLPFETIENYIRGCTFGVALYVLRENIKDRIPTKFYEFMAHKKPLIFTANPAWDTLNAQLGMGIGMPWPAADADVAAIHSRLVMGEGPRPWESLPETAWHWRTEVPALLQLMKRVLG